MKHCCVTLLVMDGLAWPERFVGEGSAIVGDLPAVVLRPHVREGRLPVMRGEKDFLVIFPRFVLWLDVKKSELTGEPAPVEVFGSHDVRVIPARAGRLRNKRILAAAKSRNERSSLFFGAIDVGGDKLPIPMNEFGHIRVVLELKRRPLPSAHAQHRTCPLPVVSYGLH